MFLRFLSRNLRRGSSFVLAFVLALAAKLIPEVDLVPVGLVYARARRGAIRARLRRAGGPGGPRPRRGTPGAAWAPRRAGEAPPAAWASRRVATTTRLACAGSPSGAGRRGAPRSWRRWPRPRRTRGSPARPASTTRGGRESVATSTPGRAGMKGGRAVRQVLRKGHPPPRRSSDDTRRKGDRARRGVSPESAWRYPCEEPYQERRPLIGLRRRGSVTHRLRRDRRVLRSGHRRRARLRREESSLYPLASEIGGCWPFVERSITEHLVW